MNFNYSAKTIELQKQLQAFMDENIYPNEKAYHEEINSGDRWKPLKLIENLKEKAKAEGLWNLFLPEVSGLTNLEYAPLAEIMGRVTWASEVFNCSAPDTGNMEVLERYGTAEQKEMWLKPLLNGEIRSCFAMTEPEVASSDATNIQGSIKRDGDFYILNGRKWWSTGAGDARCKLAIFMGKTDETAEIHKQQSMILVPMDTPGVKVLRPLPVFGFYGVPDRASEVVFENVRVPAENMLLDWVAGYQERTPSIAIQAEFVPLYQLRQQFIDTPNSERPDIFFAPSDWGGDLYANALTAPLDVRLTAVQRQQIAEVAWATW